MYWYLNAVTNSKATEDLETLMMLFPDAARRLPFHVFTPNDTDALLEELDEKTLPHLFPLYRPLDLSPDWFYGKVVDKMLVRLASVCNNNSKLRLPRAKRVSSSVQISSRCY